MDPTAIATPADLRAQMIEESPSRTAGLTASPKTSSITVATAPGKPKATRMKPLSPTGWEEVMSVAKPALAQEPLPLQKLPIEKEGPLPSKIYYDIK